MDVIVPGDAISFVLHQEMGGIPDGVHIIGNEMVFDEQVKYHRFFKEANRKIILLLHAHLEVEIFVKLIRDQRVQVMEYEGR